MNVPKPIAYLSLPYDAFICVIRDIPRHGNIQTWMISDGVSEARLGKDTAFYGLLFQIDNAFDQGRRSKSMFGEEEGKTKRYVERWGAFAW